MALTDAAIRKAKADDKAKRLVDTGGLHLFLTPAGGKLWRLRYKVDGREKLLSLGAYPQVSLADARAARDVAKADLKAGRDPGVVKKLQATVRGESRQNTFEIIAREWYELQLPTWTATHAYDVLRSFERDIFPTLGDVPIRDLTPSVVLAELRKIEKRPAVETARRIRQRMSAVFVYAIASGRADADPAAIVQGAMAPLIRGRQPAATDLDKARDIIKRADETPGQPITKLALRILAMTALRPGTLITTRWDELPPLDSDAPTWRVSAERMKMRLRHKSDAARDHMVPLATQAVEAFNAAKTLSGRQPHVFPNVRHAHKPMSENAIGYLLNRAGFHHQHVPHGWRATFSSIMNERFPADRPIIDLMLAHTPENRVEGAYNRALYLERRRELAQLWADMLMADQMPAMELLSMPRRD